MNAVITGQHADTSAVTPVVAQKRTRIVELDESFNPLFDELSEVSLARAEAERREKEIKDLLKSQIQGPEDKMETVVLKAGGKIRAKVGLRGRTSVSAKDLLAAFPEAYAATAKESTYEVISPA